MERSAFLTRLSEEVIISDGAMGTMLHARGVPWDTSFESMNVTTPQLVQSIHLEYVASGAQIIETNTFAANRFKLIHRGLENRLEEINRVGVELARSSAGKDVLVSGAMGPIGSAAIDGASDDDKKNVFTEQAQLLADAGVDLIVLETFVDLDELLIGLYAVRGVCDLPVICQMAFADGARTMTGITALDALSALETAGADVVGGNCGSGPNGLIKVLEELGQSTTMPLSALPNASFPQFVDGRYIYVNTPEYVVRSAHKLVDLGANIIGGCCGTTPEHIRLLIGRVGGRGPIERTIVPREIKSAEVYKRIEARPKKGFLSKVGIEPIVVVELDPPKGLNYARVLEGAQLLKNVGVDAITCADCSLAQLRMSSVVMGHLIQSEVGLPAIVHFACRDRNLIGQQSLLMGAAALGIEYILALTGDPAAMAGIGATTVFDTTSLGLIDMIQKLNAGVNLAGGSIQRPTDFAVGCAFDPGGRRMDGNLRRLVKKMEGGGVEYVMTQPVYDASRIREMYERTADFGVPVLVGNLPLISSGNTEFLHNEVPGITIPDETRERMAACGDDKEKSKAEGLSIAKELIDVAFDAGAPGIYIMPPFNRVDMAEPLVRYIKQECKDRLLPKPAPSVT